MSYKIAKLSKSKNSQTFSLYVDTTISMAISYEKQDLLLCTSLSITYYMITICISTLSTDGMVCPLPFRCPWLVICMHGGTCQYLIQLQQLKVFFSDSICSLIHLLRRFGTLAIMHSRLTSTYLSVLFGGQSYKHSTIRSIYNIGLWSIQNSYFTT